MFKPKKPIVPPPPVTSPGVPMPHADSPKVVADSVEFRAETPREWRCKVDGWLNTGPACTTCGTKR